MNNLKKVAVVIVLIFLAGIVFWQSKSPSDTNSSSDNVIKIGVMAPLTGDLAFLGEGFKNSIMLAEKDMNKNFPGSKHKYQIIFEDDSFDPVRGASAAQKLINTDHVDALVSFGSPVGNAVAPIAEAAHVPHINAIASDPHVAIGDYNFVHWTPASSESKLLIEELKNKGVNTIVLFEQNQAGVIAVTEAIKKDAKEAGIEIVADKKFNGNEKDFRTLIAQTRNIKADMYVLEALSPSLEILAKQIRDSGINTKFTSVETFEYTEKMSLFEGDWYVYAADSSPIFVSEYKDAYGKNPVVGSANGYDIINFIVMSAEKKGNISRDSIKNSLYTIKDYMGAVGKASIDSDGNVVTNPTLRMIKDGKPLTIRS